MAEFVQQYKEVILGVHLFGVIVGFGAAMTADMLFFRFLKDLRISHMESKVLKYVSQSVWTGIVIAFISGTFLFMGDASGYLSSAKFLAKMLIFVVIVVNGLVLHYYIHPTLTRICFGESHDHHPGELKQHRKHAFISGAVSVTSWLSVFILGLAPSPQPFSLAMLIGVYAFVLFIAVSGALTVQRFVKTS